MPSSVNLGANTVETTAASGEFPKADGTGYGALVETDATNADGLTNLKASVGDANLGNVGLALGAANVDVNSVVGDNLGLRGLVLTGQSAKLMGTNSTTNMSLLRKMAN